MFDRLLGKAALQERIEELEEERDSLAAQLDAAEERRREAARKRQDAEERVNRLEDRIAELEDRVERAEDTEKTLTARGTADIRGDRLERVLGQLESVRTEPERALTAMVVDSVPAEVRSILGERAALVERATPTMVFADDEQLVSVAMRPPLMPDPFVVQQETFSIEREWFQPRGRYAIALVRADLFAMGEYRGDERIGFSGFESDVRGDHSKGGYSQTRFERKRDQQIDEHLDQARTAISEAETDRVFVVGESTLLADFQDLATVTRPSGATGSPREALEYAYEEFWTVSLTLL